MRFKSIGRADIGQVIVIYFLYYKYVNLCELIDDTTLNLSAKTHQQIKTERITLRRVVVMNRSPLKPLNKLYKHTHSSTAHTPYLNSIPMKLNLPIQYVIAGHTIV